MKPRYLQRDHTPLQALVFRLICLAGLVSACESGTAKPPAPKTLLVVTHTTGFRHSSIPAAETTLGNIAEDNGAVIVEFCRTGEDVRKMLVLPALDRYDGVFFANTSGDLGIPDLTAFLDWVRSGRAFLGTHSAADTYHGEPAYIEMLGAEFRTHGNQTEALVLVENAQHPAVAHLYPSFRIFDELYELVSNPRPRAHILLSLDHHPDDGHPEAGTSGDFPLAWYHRHGEGRVFYTALGHREDVWESESFRQHLQGAIQWALGLD